MTDSTLRDEATKDDAPATLADPTAVRDRDDVDAADRHSVVDEDHFVDYEAWAGMAVVGILDDAGRPLLLTREDGRHGILPHEHVDPGEDYATVARRAAESATGLPVRIDDVERVRRVRYRHEDDEARRTERFDVVFRATPTTDAAPTADREGWTATWTDEVPDNPDWNHDDVLADVRLFVE